MRLTELHITILQSSSRDVVVLPRLGSRTTAMKQLIVAGYLRPKTKRVCNLTMTGYVITEAGRKALVSSLEAINEH